MSADESCEHYDAQFAVRIHEVEITDRKEVERFCDWCNGFPDILIVKDERHSLVFCEECRDIIRILASGDRESQEN